MKTFKILRRKAFMTLLEVLIALGLISILLLVVFSIYRYIDISQLELSNIRSENFNLRYVQSRLARVFSQVVPTNVAHQYFYVSESNQAEIQSKSLIFTYDNGSDITAIFSNEVIGRLFLDKEKNLCLATWHHSGEIKGKKEILLNNVTNLAFAFYAPPLNQKKIPLERQNSIVVDAPLAGQWNSEWHLSYKEIPVMIKISIVREKLKGRALASEPIEFVFPIPNTNHPIVYKSG